MEESNSERAPCSQLSYLPPSLPPFLSFLFPLSFVCLLISLSPLFLFYFFYFFLSSFLISSLHPSLPFILPSSLTLDGKLMNAPSSRRSVTMSVCPFSAATISAVYPSCYTTHMRRCESEKEYERSVRRKTRERERERERNIKR
jgi:hypothetical protein